MPTPFLSSFYVFSSGTIRITHELSCSVIQSSFTLFLVTCSLPSGSIGAWSPTSDMLCASYVAHSTWGSTNWDSPGNWPTRASCFLKPSDWLTGHQVTQSEPTRGLWPPQLFSPLELCPASELILKPLLLSAGSGWSPTEGPSGNFIQEPSLATVERLVVFCLFCQELKVPHLASAPHRTVIFNFTFYQS